MKLLTELQPHQDAAVEKLSKIKIGAAYMEMGTGKTRTALELIIRRLVAGKVNYAIWLCPCSVKSEIEAEIKKHVDGKLPITIAGIESLSSSIRLNIKLLKLVRENQVFLIVDESNLVKNNRAKRTENIQRLSDNCKYKLILNGTPISKSEKDLFSQWQILDWRILGYKSFWSFAANHLEYDERIKGKINRCLNVDYLVRKIAPYTYQVKKSECLQLPEKTYSTKYFELTESQKWHYQDVKEAFLMQVDELDSTTIYRLFTALQHVLSGNRIISKYKDPIRTEPFFKDPLKNPRIQKLLDLVSRTDEKIIIWCKFTHEIQEIEQVLTNEYGFESVVTFYGEVKRKQRVENIQKFSDSARFFIANKTCAGYGLNLQFCSYEIFYSNDWNYATRAQAEDRAHRIGQMDNVHILDICADETLDERILDCLNKKERLADSFKYQIEKMKDTKDLGRWLDGAKVIRKQKCV